jgi:cell division protease FtsH
MSKHESDHPELPPEQPTPWKVEGEPEDESRPPRRKLLPTGRRFWVLVGVLLMLNLALAVALVQPPERTTIPYTEFRDLVEAGDVHEVTSSADVIQGELDHEIERNGERFQEFETRRPFFADDNLLAKLERNDVTILARAPEERPLWQVIVFGFGPTLLLVGVLVLLLRRGGGLLRIGKSKAALYDASQHRTTFEDVAGIDDAKEALVEIVDFLRNPARYQALGAAIPRGVLLSGPPGTGKTLLARAVAGEAGVPFYSMSASEFIEMVVGVGASRVRDLFKQAKEHAPAIVFIDELDAIGRSRGGRGPSFGSAGSDEREQTLNQILTEMDGFTGAEGVIVLAATNRPEILDAALLRPGRFDRRVAVNPPDRNGREHILRVHTRNVPLAEDVKLERVAASTPGMVGADLRNLVNEAALLTARAHRTAVRTGDFMEALEKVVLGAERRIALSPFDRERTAYHEAGHALLGMLEPGADPVRKVSIVPRGLSLGVTLQSPDADRYGYSARYLRGRIMGLLGGRAAEQLVYDDVTTGAETDLEQVTKLARQMVGRWGMSERIGLVTVLPRGDDLSGMNTAEATRELVDNEVRRIVSEAYQLALTRLREHRDRLEALAQALLERETLDEEDAYEAAGFGHQLADEAADAVADGPVATGSNRAAGGNGAPPERAADTRAETPAGE